MPSLLDTATIVMTKELPALEGRWQVSAAVLLRQALEQSAESWLTDQGIDPERRTGRETFLLLKALHPNPELAAELHWAYDRLSDACHASSHSNPPTAEELHRWKRSIEKFIAA